MSVRYDVDVVRFGLNSQGARTVVDVGVVDGRLSIRIALYGSDDALKALAREIVCSDGADLRNAVYGAVDAKMREGVER
jgi:hypothetical protein